MKRSVKKALLGVAASAMMGAVFVSVTTTSAYAIDTVPCGPSDYLRITVHNFGRSTHVNKQLNSVEELPVKMGVMRVALSAVAAAAMTATFIGVTATSASAIDSVPCTSDEYVRVTVHATNSSNNYDVCYANGGWVSYHDAWITHIWTGNNRVQWYGDGRWQPDQPIPPHTNYSWPNHPGGVSLGGISIV